MRFLRNRSIENTYKCHAKLAIMVALLGLGSLLLVNCNKRAITGQGINEGGAEAAINPYNASLRKLTYYEYKASIRSALGEDISKSDLNDDKSFNGFLSIGAARLTLSKNDLQSYKNAADRIAESISSDNKRSSLFSCGSDKRECFIAAIKFLSIKLWRRPVSNEEGNRYLAMAESYSADKGVKDGVYAIAYAMLQSPHFLYRVEIGSRSNTGDYVYDDYELATKLSYFLWGEPPSQSLLDAASNGQLSNPTALKELVIDMIKSEKYKDGIANLFRDYFELDNLDKIQKEGDFESLKPLLKQQTLDTLKHFITNENGDFRDIFTYTKTAINSQLASHYGLNASGDGFNIIDIPQDKLSQRRGILANASFLSMFSHTNRTSPTLRGIFVRQKLLCDKVSPPPNNANTAIPEASGDFKTLRERLETVHTQGSCAGCHSAIDPIGFAFEGFDAVGKFRNNDNGEPIDASGNIDELTFNNYDGFTVALKNHEQLPQCLVLNLTRYANGRLETDNEMAIIESLTSDFVTNGYNFRSLVANFVTSDLFTRRPPP